MAAKFRKIDPRIWNDERFCGLTATEKLVALYLLASPQVNRIGIFAFSPAMGAESTGIPHKEFERVLGRVCHTLKWHFDKASKVMYFPTWWKYNPCNSDTTMKGFLEDIHDVPQSVLLQQFKSNERYLSGLALKAFREGMPEGMGMGIGDQEQEQEQEKEQEQEQKKEAPPVDLFDEFWAAFPSGRKSGKEAARKAWAKAITKCPQEQVVAAAAEYAASAVGQGEYVKQPATWLNQGCWDDDRRSWNPESRTHAVFLIGIAAATACRMCCWQVSSSCQTSSRHPNALLLTSGI